MARKQYFNLNFEGHIGSDLELQYTGSGKAVCNFRVANNNVFKRGDESVTETLWFKVACWGQQAEFMSEYAKKGSHVIIEGRLRGDENGNPGTFTRQDGTAGASFEVTALNVYLLDTKAKSESTDEDLPF